MPSKSTPLVFNSTSSTTDVEAFTKNVSIVLYTLTIVLGIPGNSMVIWVAGFKLKPKVTNVWLVNLAVADLIFCFTRIPFVIQKLSVDHWSVGSFLCKFSGFFKYTNMFCSMFLLAVISVDRALCVWRPVFTKRRRTLFVARIVAVCVWILAIIFSTPFIIYRQFYLGKNNLSKCSLDEEKAKGNNTANLTPYIIRFLFGFLLPFMVILVCYILAGLGIKRTRLSGKSRPLRIMVTLVIAFFLCWAPYHCLLLVKMVDRENILVKTWYPVARSMAYFNSCVNPILYYCMGVIVRGSFRQSLAGVCRRALEEDVEGTTTQSMEMTEEESSCHKPSGADRRNRSTEEVTNV